MAEEREPVARFWSAFHRYEHGRCWFGDMGGEEEAGEEGEGVLLEWEVRGPARFEVERERALRLGGSRLAARAQPPYGEAGLCGRASYTLQLLASLYGLAERVEAVAQERGWSVSVGVLAYRESQELAEDAEPAAGESEELIVELDPEELAGCDTLVVWIEVEVPASAEAAWRLGDAMGRLLSGAARWLERLDAGDREALRSLPRLQA